MGHSIKNDRHSNRSNSGCSSVVSRSSSSGAPWGQSAVIVNGSSSAPWGQCAVINNGSSSAPWGQCAVIVSSGSSRVSQSKDG